MSSSVMPDISKIFVNYLRNSRQLSCPICQADVKPPTLDGFKQHVEHENSAEKHPTEEKAILDAFQQMKLASSKPQPQPISTTEQDQNKRLKKRSPLDQPNNQQNLEHTSSLNTKDRSDNEGRNKKIYSPSSSTPPSTPTRRGRGRQQADNLKEFDRGTNMKGSSTRQLWSPSGGLPRSSQFRVQPPGNRPTQHKIEKPDPEPSPEAEEDDSYTEDPSISQLIRQPETRPISQEQLVAEVKGIYAGLVMVESKCIEVDNAHSPQQLNNEQWQALIALHRTLLHEHHDFFLANQHPSASPALRRLAFKYSMPARMWRHGIHSFLELLRHRLPLTLEHMLTFIYIAYSMMALIQETVPAFEDAWTECLGDIGRYRTTIKDDPGDLETWTAVSRYWKSHSRPSGDKASPLVGPRTLLHEHHDFPLANQHPRSSLTSRKLASKSTMSERMRSHNILNQRQQLSNKKIDQEYPLADSTDKQYYVAGMVNKIPIEAFPDTGADKCFISSKLASHLGLHPVPGTQERITLANKKVVESLWMVQVPWEFAIKRKKHMMKCWILPTSIHDLVLGRSFLEATNTLKKYSKRIESKLLGAVKKLGTLKKLGLWFLGGKQRLRGYINGHLTAALPDTGSDAMFVNGAYAREIGLNIDSDVKNLVEVELADGSTTMTSGIVRDVQWKVGKTTVQCTFYVLEDLCTDVILSNSYLFDMNIFSEQEEHFFDMDSEDHFDDCSSYFCNLRLLKNKNVAPPKAFSPEMTQHELEQLEKWEKMEELFRRDENRDWMEGLPKEQQEKAAQDEEARRQCWEASRKERKAKWAAASHTAKGNVRDDTDLISRLKKRFRIGTPLKK
ncbi:hypothetical protein Trisim1_001418 [Trichoderma cf. simile WF8]